MGCKCGDKCKCVVVEEKSDGKDTKKVICKDGVCKIDEEKNK